MPHIVTPSRPLGELPEALTADEAAPYLRQSGRHTRRLIANGDLDNVVVEVGARKFISRELLRRFLRGELDAES